MDINTDQVTDNRKKECEGEIAIMHLGKWTNEGVTINGLYVRICFRWNVKNGEIKAQN